VSTIRNVAGTSFVETEFRNDERKEAVPLYRVPYVHLFLNEETKEDSDRISASLPLVEYNARLRSRCPDKQRGNGLEHGCKLPRPAQMGSRGAGFPRRDPGMLWYADSTTNNCIRPNWIIERDVAYGSEPEQLADLYLLKDRRRNRAIIFIHGGGWVSGDKSGYAARAKKYALAGFSVIAVNYTLAKRHDERTKWPKQLEDIQTAVRWVRKNAASFGVDPNRIAAGGDSSGGHLALFLGALDEAVEGTSSILYSGYSSKVSVVLNMFGPSNLAAPDMIAAIWDLSLFSERTIESFAKASPINYISPTMSPVCTIHGNSDQVIPYSQSVALHKELDYHGVANKLVTFHGGHEIETLTKWRRSVLDLLGLNFVSKHV
jgi:acetyl esterase/lipase